MAGSAKWTEELIEDGIKAGCGQGGRGGREGYRPWIRVQEFSSRDTQTGIPSPKLDRTVHTFSYLERAPFLFKEFEMDFFDWNEQPPIPRDIALGIATALGIRHLRYPKTKVQSS